MVDRVKALMPQLRASVSPAIDIDLAVDRSTTIRASLRDVEITLIIAVMLVILVVFAFLRNARATLVPVVAVSVSLVATFAVMYLLGYSLDIFSLMALTVATGFVVDDAIVVLENITRHLDAGMSPLEAALNGAREVGFTVLSMSVSLIAVFVPILLMGGIVGRLFREFAMTIIDRHRDLAGGLADDHADDVRRVAARGIAARRTDGFIEISERFFEAMLSVYRRTLAVALRHPRSVMLILAAVLGLNFYLYGVVPKGFVPQQDTGLLIGSIQADQSISFQLMQQKLTQFIDIVKSDPAVDIAVGFTGGAVRAPAAANQLRHRVRLAEADWRTQDVGRPGDRAAAGRARRGGRRHAVPAGGAAISAPAAAPAMRSINTPCRARRFEELNEWTPKIVAALQPDPALADVSSDQQNKGLQSDLVIDRDAAAQLGNHGQPDRQHAV